MFEKANATRTLEVFEQHVRDRRNAQVLMELDKAAAKETARGLAKAREVRRAGAYVARKGELEAARGMRAREVASSSLSLTRTLTLTLTLTSRSSPRSPRPT